MYLTMGAGMLGWSLPSFLQGNMLALTLTQMILSKGKTTDALKSLMKLARRPLCC